MGLKMSPAVWARRPSLPTSRACAATPFRLPNTRCCLQSWPWGARCWPRVGAGRRRNWVGLPFSWLLPLPLFRGCCCSYGSCAARYQDSALYSPHPIVSGRGRLAVRGRCLLFCGFLAGGFFSSLFCCLAAFRGSVVFGLLFVMLFYVLCRVLHVMCLVAFWC